MLRCSCDRITHCRSIGARIIVIVVVVISIITFVVVILVWLP